MFCQHCGKPLPDGAAFCPACGGGISAPATDYQAQKQAVRDSEIAVLRDAIRHFEQKRQQYAAYDNACAMFNHYARGARSTLIAFGAVLLSLSVLILAVVVAPEIIYERQTVTDLWVVLFGALAPGIIMLTVGISLKVNCRRQYVRYYAQCTQLADELYAHYTEYYNCPVGQEYTNPAVLTVILDVLQSGRADTIKDALNIALNDVNRRRMDAYLAAIESNTAATARFAAARFFLK